MLVSSSPLHLFCRQHLRLVHFRRRWARAASGKRCATVDGQALAETPSHAPLDGAACSLRPVGRYVGPSSSLPPPAARATFVATFARPTAFRHRRIYCDLQLNQPRSARLKSMALIPCRRKHADYLCTATRSLRIENSIECSRCAHQPKGKLAAQCAPSWKRSYQGHWRLAARGKWTKAPQATGVIDEETSGVDIAQVLSTTLAR